MTVRVSRASAVVVQRVPPAAVDWFMEWQNGISVAAEAFPGYQGTDIFPATDGRNDEWVVVVHFLDDATLRQWLDSPVRTQWVEKLREKIGEFELKTLPGGFSFWFTNLAQSPEGMPPEWKMVLAVLIGLYPTVMLLTIIVGPLTAPLGIAVSMLIANIASLILIQWAVQPLVNYLLRPWLKANGKKSTAMTIGGVAAILVYLGVLVFLFHLATQ